MWLDRMHLLDTHLCLCINRLSRLEPLCWLLRGVSRLGDGVFWYVLMLGILLVERSAGVEALLHMLLAGVGSILVYRRVKGRTLRPRPYQVHQAIKLHGVPLDYFSFPSGHTLHAVALTTVALAYYPGLAWLLVPFTLLVAASRVVLGLHYPSDVMAGAVLGAGMATVCLAI